MNDHDLNESSAYVRQILQGRSWEGGAPQAGSWETSGVVSILKSRPAAVLLSLSDSDLLS